MGRVIYRPSAIATIVTGATGSTPLKLPKVLHVELATTLAPAVGQGQLVIANPDGTWTNTLKPNDILTVVLSSRKRTAQAEATGGTNDPTWTGLVDQVLAVTDPRSPYGRACQIDCSTFWKLFTITAVPLYRFFNGAYVASNITLGNLLQQAAKDAYANTGINFPVVIDSAVNFVQTGDIPLPNNYTDPGEQSWASFLLSTVLVTGVEVYFDESGTLIARPPAYRTNTAVANIPAEEVFTFQHGVSDQGLITNVVVAYTPKPGTQWGVVAPAQPAGSVAMPNIGPLPPSLLGTDGKPLPRLGQRFVSLQVGWLDQRDQAGEYANVVRNLGLANADLSEAAVALNGDVRIGTTISYADWNRRYYLSTISHSYDYGGSPETQISGRFGMALNAAWSSAPLGSYSDVAQSAAAAMFPTDPSQVTPAGLPDLGGDPSVIWQKDAPTLSWNDIQRFLSQHTPPSPLYPYAQRIWQDAQRTAILPAFALAVWQAETQEGTDGSAGSQGKNPGNVGPGFTYPDWGTAIDAWFTLIANSPYVGAGNGTISAIAAIYAPNDQGQNPHWLPNVLQTFRDLRGGALLPAVPDTPPETTPTPGTPRAVIVAAAQSMVGGTYGWGAENPTTRTFDCSGLTEWAYRQAGLDFGVSRSTAQVQQDYCRPITPAMRQPGDLIFFHVVADGLGDYINHVALYVGNGQIVQAAQPSIGIIQDVLTQDSINDSYASTGRHPKLT